METLDVSISLSTISSDRPFAGLDNISRYFKGVAEIRALWKRAGMGPHTSFGTHLLRLCVQLPGGQFVTFLIHLSDLYIWGFANKKGAWLFVPKQNTCSNNQNARLLGRWLEKVGQLLGGAQKLSFDGSYADLVGAKAPHFYDMAKNLNRIAQFGGGRVLSAREKNSIACAVVLFSEGVRFAKIESQMLQVLSRGHHTHVDMNSLRGWNRMGVEL